MKKKIMTILLLSLIFFSFGCKLDYNLEIKETGEVFESVSFIDSSEDSTIPNTPPRWYSFIVSDPFRAKDITTVYNEDTKVRTYKQGYKSLDDYYTKSPFYSREFAETNFNTLDNVARLDYKVDLAWLNKFYGKEFLGDETLNINIESSFPIKSSLKFDRIISKYSYKQDNFSDTLSFDVEIDMNKNVLTTANIILIVLVVTLVVGVVYFVYNRHKKNNEV